MSDDQETVVGGSGLNCTQCGCSNVPGVLRCCRCGAPLDVARAATSESVVAPQTAVSGVSVSGVLSLGPGIKLAGRYEILELLGEGGMGAVYKARDTELDRLVAVKIIRPELAGRPEILQRFKQELILARQITHKNVIRIFDLGEGDGMKFITMEFVEGQDLKQTLHQKGRLDTKEAVRMVQQVCAALDAAHSEGVIHRDLKPQNIMLDRHGRALVMDFGIARTMEITGLTQTGTLVGTPEYMSPEQAKGEKVDTRSDLFTLGVIFYELLTGQSPYSSETAMGTLLKRVQQRATPPIDIDPAVPQELSDIVVKCLTIDPAERYQTAHEMLLDLEDWAGPVSGTPSGFTRHGSTVLPKPAVRTEKPKPWWRPIARWGPWAAAGVAVLLFAFTVVIRQRQTPVTPRTGQQPITVLVADFNNATSDPVFNGTLEPTFITAMEGASFISSAPRGEARRVASELQPGAAKLDESLARLVAARQGINYIVSGSIDSNGDGYRLSIKAINAVTGKTAVSQTADAGNKNGVLIAVGKLAARVRNALGDDTPEALQLAAAETYTAASLEAAQTYERAQELRFAGKGEEAIRSYLRAIQLDPNFGIAYAGLGMTYHSLGLRPEADRYFQMALARIDRLSDREKYRVRGAYYAAVRNHQKAIEEFTALVKQYPSDMAGLNNLAVAYYLGHDMAAALKEGRRALQVYPQNLPQRNNVAQYALYAGDFDTAAREAHAVAEIRPSYLKAYRAQALAELAQGKPAQAVETYRRLQAVSPLGASFAAVGLADLFLYEGRASEAAAILEKSVDADVANKNPKAAAKKLATLAQAKLALGQKPAALAAADRALELSKDPSVVYPVSQIYLELGREAKALALASELGQRFEADPQAYAKLIEGEAQLVRRNARQAIKSFQEAQRLADTWIGRFDLGRAFVEAAAFPEADSELETCLKRRGEAAELFLMDDLPTYRYVPAVHYQLGLAREGLNSPGAADAYRAFLAIKEKSEKNPLVEDARRRLARQ